VLRNERAMLGSKEDLFVTDQQRQQILNNRNVWNDPELATQDRYPVMPESDGTDRPLNPYSEV
jgi:hypothetical protein